MNVLNVDGDSILYRGCFACERTLYIVQGPSLEKTFDSKKALDAYLGALPSRDNLELFKHGDLKPLEYALGTMKSMLNKIKGDLEASELHIYLTGGKCFRYKLAKTYPYKGNREKTHKPHWLPEAVEYLKKYWNAEICTDIEADDALGINQTDRTVLVSPDKDLDQIPGWHYNNITENLYHVDDITAAYCLWSQMLTGDKTDNIHGIDGIGPVRVRALLEDLKTESAMRDRVFSMYMEHFEEKASERFNENLGLLTVLRKKL